MGLDRGRGVRKSGLFERSPEMPFLELELSAVIDVLKEAAAASPEMAASGPGPLRRGGLDADDLGDAGGPALPDDLDADDLSGDGAGDEELAAPGLGLSVARGKIDVRDLDREATAP